MQILLVQRLLLLKYISKDKNKKFIVATEPHILHQMKKNEPNKTFLVAPGKMARAHVQIVLIWNLIP